MEKLNFNKLLGFLLIFGFISSIIIGFSVINNVVMYDEGIVAIYDIADDVLIGSNIKNESMIIIEDIANKFSKLPENLDTIWFVSFVSFVIGFLYLSYYSKRLGYFSMYSISSYGIIIFMFLLSIYVQLNDWLNNIFMNIVPTAYPNMIFFNWYSTNIGIITIVLIILGIILNHVNINVNRFISGKNNEVDTLEEM